MRSRSKRGLRNYATVNGCGFWYIYDAGIQEFTIPQPQAQGNAVGKVVFYADPRGGTAIVQDGQNFAIRIGDNTMDGGVRLSYQSLYDAYRIRKVRMRFWLKDTDQFTEASYQTVRCIKAYDPDALGRPFEREGDYTGIAKKRFFFMKPNRQYKMSIVPEYGILRGSSTQNDQATSSVYDKKRPTWQDVRNFASTTAAPYACKNAWQLYIDANANQKISVQLEYFIEFKGKRNNQTYGPVP